MSTLVGVIAILHTCWVYFGEFMERHPEENCCHFSGERELSGDYECENHNKNTVSIAEKNPRMTVDKTAAAPWPYLTLVLALSTIWLHQNVTFF